ncbi:MAG: hypothetical protein Q9181_000149 [Wetmoreana brouardii]
MSGGFAVPFSSSPPSTPDSRRTFSGGRGLGTTGFAPHPSTTPAGLPPSSANSFTPAGPPPPSSIFGSSNLKSGNNLFSSKLNSKTEVVSRPTTQGRPVGGQKSIPHAWAPSTNTSLLGSTPLKPDSRGRTFAVPDSSSLIDLTADNDDQNWSEDDMEEADEGDGGHELDVSTKGSIRFDSLAHNRRVDPTPFKSSVVDGSLASPGGLIDWARSDFGSSIGVGTPRSTKRPRDSMAAYTTSSRRKPPAKRQKKESAIPGIIKDMSARLDTARLQESDDLILGSEACVGQVYQAEVLPEGQEKAVEVALLTTSRELCDLWRVCREQDVQDVNMEDDVVIGIGPNEDATAFRKATFLAPLLLQIHHPPPLTGKQAFASSRSFRSSHSPTSRESSEPPTKTTPLPRVLRDWLEEHHNPYGSAPADLQIYTPNPTAHRNYWDMLFNMLVRGKLFDVVQTLKKSKFEYACTARETDGSSGYHGTLLKNIGTLVSRMARVLEDCPILREDNWAITGNDWRLYRKRIDQALADLTDFVEGSSPEQEGAVPELEAPNFGLQSTTSSLGKSVRSAERKIPAIIYENLRTMYGIILGKTPEIVSSAQNWVEATLGLTLWWDGEDDDDEDLAASFIQSRRSLRQSRSRGDRTVDFNPTAAYIRRLAAAFERVTDDDDPDLFQINSNNIVEVGLASVFEGNVEGVIGLLHKWSLPVVSAVAEIANLAGWFESPAGAEKLGGFDQEDLLVLSYAQQEKALTSDAILVDYADQLFQKDVLKSVVTGDQIEGWEVSMQVLARLDDEGLGIKKLGELLRQLPLTSDKRVDKLLRLCRGSGLEEEASSIAERYADHFTNETDKYGNALIYYARARQAKKVKNILDLLISLSLVESKAFPPSSSLDDNLRALNEIPKESLAVLASLDPEAAQIVHLHMTGYASLRKFYELRDQEVCITQDQQRTSLRPMARRKAAIATLIAVINSAADNIHGGLYDKDRRSIVPVDGLLALLGEALPFIDQPQRELSLPQCLDLLKAIEDLQTVTSRVYEQCEECFRCTLANRQAQRKSLSRREMFKKSISNVTTSSSAFSLIDSMTESEMRESTGSEGVMVRRVGKDDSAAEGKEERRGWDWRKGVDSDITGADLLRMMRLGLAKDVAKAWVEGEES